jgi:hypothetical protein
MTKEEIYAIINANPVFHLATVEGDQPRVRALLIYSAGDGSIVFTRQDADPSASSRRTRRLSSASRTTGTACRSGSAASPNSWRTSP